MIIENPPLNAVYLAHFGTKGMKWGHRKKRPDEKERAKFFSKTNAKKAGTAVAVVAGVAIVAAVMTKGGRNTMTNIATTNYVQSRQAKAAAGQSPFGPLTNLYKTTKTSVLTPFEAGARPNRLAVTGTNYTPSRLLAARQADTQRLVDKTWRDQARMSRLISDMDKPTNPIIDRLLNNGTRLAQVNTYGYANVR